MLAPFIVEQPDQIEAVALLAEAYEAHRSRADAIALLEKAVEESPSFRHARRMVKTAAGGAPRAHRGAVEAPAEPAVARSQWAAALLTAGDAQRREVFEEAAAEIREQPRLYLLAEAQRRTRPARGRGDCAQADSRGPETWPRRELAQISRTSAIIRRSFPAGAHRQRAFPHRRGRYGGRRVPGLYFDLVAAYEQPGQHDKALGI